MALWYILMASWFHGTTVHFDFPAKFNNGFTDARTHGLWKHSVERRETEILERCKSKSQKAATDCRRRPKGFQGLPITLHDQYILSD